MASIASKLLTGLAAAFVTAGATSSESEARAAELLQTAQVTADRLTACPATADDLVGDATLRILQRHPEAFEEAEGWHAYVRQCIRNAFKDDLRRRSWTRHEADLAGSDLDGDEAQGSVFDYGLAPLEYEDAAEALGIEEFRSGLAPAEREVLNRLLLGQRERQIAQDLARTRHDVRASLQRLRRAAERVFDASDGDF